MENETREETSAVVETKEAKKIPPLTTPSAIIIAGILIALAIVFTNTKSAPDGSQPVAKVDPSIFKIRNDDHVDGNVTKAQVAIFEYSDSDCPFCERFHPTLQQIRNEYGDKVAWVYRHYPLTSLHPNAFNEAIALECAASIGGNEIFWNYLNTLVKTTAGKGGEKVWTTTAVQMGVDETRFAQCLTNESVAAKVQAQAAEAQAIGAQGTPFSVVVNLKTKEQVTIPGAYPIEEVRSAIDSILK